MAAVKFRRCSPKGADGWDRIAFGDAVAAIFQKSSNTDARSGGQRLEAGGVSRMPA
jgi:hypothetical protein